MNTFTNTQAASSSNRTRNLQSWLSSAEPAVEQCYGYNMSMYGDSRRMWMKRGIDARVSMGGRPPISAGFILEQAASRYFQLLDAAQEGMVDLLSETEMRILLNTECTPLWESSSTNLATMVADDNGVESLDDLAEGSPLRVLLEKLLDLTPLQHAALLDACERIWRGHESPLE